MKLFLILLAIYIVFIYLFSRLVIPFLGFKKTKIPLEISSEFEEVINKINKKSKTDYDFLKNSYDFVVSKYSGQRLETIIKFKYIFKNPFEFKSRFMPCTLQNHLLRTILIKSGRFSDDNIKLVIVPFNLIIHQYLKVRIDDRWINVDPWSNHLGVPFGKRSFLFG